MFNNLDEDTKFMMFVSILVTITVVCISTMILLHSLEVEKTKQKAFDAGYIQQVEGKYDTQVWVKR